MTSKIRRWNTNLMQQYTHGNRVVCILLGIEARKRRTGINKYSLTMPRIGYDWHAVLNIMRRR